MTTLVKEHSYTTRIDINAETRQVLADILNQALASGLDLKTQVKQAHWNVKGSQFFFLHELFDEMASELEEYNDMLAERTTALGNYAYGTARMAAQNSVIPEYPVSATDGREHVIALADRYALFGKTIREAIGQSEAQNDASTADLFTEISRGIDKRLWFLEAHLQAK